VYEVCTRCGASRDVGGDSLVQVDQHGCPLCEDMTRKQVRAMHRVQRAVNRAEVRKRPGLKLWESESRHRVKKPLP
jgi:hypothetical protein